MSTVMNWNRREFLDYARKGGLVLGAGMSSYSDLVQAQANDDEHFFIFVELRGGIQWMVATDGRDVAKLPMDNPKRVATMEIKDTPPTPAEFEALVNGDRNNRQVTNGNFILVPYIGDLTSSYKKGVTSLGNEYILGFAAQALLPHVDDIAVLRGSHVQGDFHGISNASGEIFSGLNSSETSHIASILSPMLAKKYGNKLLDNLVFENATFSTGSAQIAKMPVRLDAESLGYIVANADALGDDAAAARFAKAKQLSEALGAQSSLSELHRKTFSSYVAAMKDAPTVRSMLLKLKNELAASDASLDLNMQFKTATTLIQAGLTRVITLCLGSPNGKNKVDGFGLFDCHRGLYHLNDIGDFTANTQRHHLNVDRAMQAVAALVKQLKTTKFGTTTKTLFDVTTVVLGTEFARPSNFFGNEAFGGEGNSNFGNGHYWYNNNYIMFGKGVKGGTWVGGGDPIRQMGHRVDFATADAANANDVKLTPVEFTFTPQGGFGGGDDIVDPDQPPAEGATPPPPPAVNPEDGPGFYTPKDLNYQGQTDRPFMAKDMIRTIMAVAGQEARYAEAYTDAKVANAKTIRCLVK